MGHKSTEELRHAINDAAAKVPIGSRYSHYKNGDSIYKVINIVIDEATEEPLVVYRSENGKRLTFARTISSWIEIINYNDEKIRRFQPLVMI